MFDKIIKNIKSRLSNQLVISIISVLLIFMIILCFLTYFQFSAINNSELVTSVSQSQQQINSSIATYNKHKISLLKQISNNESIRNYLMKLVQN